MKLKPEKWTFLVLMTVLMSVLVFGLRPVPAYADETETAETEEAETDDEGLASGTCGDALTWEIDSDGTLTISGSGSMEDYDNSNPVPWNQYQDDIYEVVINEGITTVGDYAFYWCDMFEEVTLPSTLISIGNHSFYQCQGLKTINFDENLTSIGNYAFYNCISLQSVAIPDNVTTIGQYGFASCSSLTSVTLPAGLTEIEYQLFSGCSELAGITIPDFVTSISSLAFNSCGKLSSITIPNGVTSIGSNAFAGTALTSVTLPSGLTEISSSLFYGSALESIVIPDGVTTIGEAAFAECDSLNSVTLPEALLEIGSEAFYNCEALTALDMPAYITTFGTNAISSSVALSGYGNSFSACYAVQNGNPWTSKGNKEITDITVSTTSELLAAIGSYRHIILEDGIYETLGTVGIKNVCALTIEARNSGYAEILCQNLNTIVVQVNTCYAVSFNGIIMGHVTGAYGQSCGGNGVVYQASYSTNPSLIDCDLFGCGTIAVQLYTTTGFTADGCVLRDCMYYALYSYLSDAEFTDCVVSGNGYDYINYLSSVSTYCLYLTGDEGGNTISFTDSTFLWNLHSKRVPDSLASDVTFTNCIEEDNVWQDGTVMAYGICVNGITWQVEDGTLRLGYDLSFDDDDNTVIKSETGAVLPYSDSSIPWIDYLDSITKYDLADGVTYDGAPTDISSATLTLPATNYTYNGSARRPLVTVVYGGKTLVSGTDYTVSYSNNTNVGTATVTVTGKGDYSGTATTTFEITKGYSTITATPTSSSLICGQTTAIDVSVNSDGNLSSTSSDTSVATVKGLTITAVGAGTATITVTVQETDNYYLNRASFTITVSSASQSLSVSSSSVSLAVGKTFTPTVSGAKTTLSYKSADTSIATVNASTGKIKAVKVGTVKITVTAAATTTYSKATATITVKVTPKATSSLKLTNTSSGVKLTWKKVTGATGYYIYRSTSESGTYKKIATVKSGSTVTYTNKTSGTYKVTNGKTYYYKVAAYAATGEGTASSVETAVRLTGVTLSSVKNSASKKMTVKWKKNSKATGYQIQYSTSSSFASGNKTVSVSKAATVSKTIGSLKKGKTYYVRIRAYKTVSGTKYYSAWSAKKKVKISK